MVVDTCVTAKTKTRSHSNSTGLVRRSTGQESSLPGRPSVPRTAMSALPRPFPVFSHDGESQHFEASSIPHALFAGRPLQHVPGPLSNSYRGVVVLDHREEDAAGAEIDKPSRQQCNGPRRNASPSNLRGEPVPDLSDVAR